jgi:hypothetical protein
LEITLGGFLLQGVEFEPDGGADEAEGGADLVGEEVLEGEVELDVAVGEEDEGGRGDGVCDLVADHRGECAELRYRSGWKLCGDTPSTLNLAPGKHDIVVKKTCYKDWTRTMAVSAGTIRVSADIVAAQ